jgi:hypothetical protein
MFFVLLNILIYNRFFHTIKNVATNKLEGGVSGKLRGNKILLIKTQVYHLTPQKMLNLLK